MKADFFGSQMHPICTLPKRKGLTILANPLVLLAGATGLEPATSGVTGRRSNQLNYAPLYNFGVLKKLKQIYLNS